MWYEDKGVISIGCQSGGPQDNGIGEIKVDLWKALLKNTTSTYCTDVDHFALALRVGGKFTDYEDEKIWKVRRSKKDRYIGVDIDIPMSVWSEKTTDELKYYLSGKVLEAIQVLIARLQKDKVEIDEERLVKDVRSAVEEFNQIVYENV